MAGEILPDSHVSVLYNLSNYLNELEEVMDRVDENRSMKNRSPGTVGSSRSRKRQTLQAENKQYRKQRRYFTKATAEGFSEREDFHPEGSRRDETDTPEYVPCEVSHYLTYASPRCRNPHQRKAKRLLKGNESHMNDDERCSKSSSETITMRVIQDEMKEMKEKLSAVVETLSNVAEALVKTVAENDRLGASGDEKQFQNEKAVQSDYENTARAQRRGQSGFCCFGLRAVESSESVSDYYRPHRPENSESKVKKENNEGRPGPPISGNGLSGESLSSESRDSRGCQNITGCYLIQRFLNRVKLLFF